MCKRASLISSPTAAGTTGELIVIPRSATGLWVRRLGIHGHVDQNARPTIRKNAGDNYSTSFAVIEERGIALNGAENGAGVG